MTTKSRTRQLTFTPEAKELLTPFRKYALEKVFQFACRELGSSLETADVSAYCEYDDPGTPILLLNLFADIDGHEWDKARKAITKSEMEEAASWTDAEREDWSKTVCFFLWPLRT